MPKQKLNCKFQNVKLIEYKKGKIIHQNWVEMNLLLKYHLIENISCVYTQKMNYQLCL